MMAGWRPEVANRVVDQLNEGEDLEACFGEVSAVADQLGRQGFVGRLSLVNLKDGSSAARPSFTGAWRVATWLATSRVYFRETVMIAQSCAADQAHLRSHSRPGSSEVFHGSPNQLEIHRLPLHITESRCEFGARHDRAGRHRAACARSG